MAEATPARRVGHLRRNLDADFDQVLTSDPTDGSSPVPWLAIQVGKSEGLYVGWEFSGIGRIHARNRELRVGNLPEFKTDLPAGETFQVPPAFVGCYTGDIDDGSYSLHRFVLERLLPPLPKGQAYPTLAYNLYLDSGGEKAPGGGCSAQRLPVQGAGPSRHLFRMPCGSRRPATGAGIRRVFLDLLFPIEEFVHQNGMKLGLWVAWTQGSQPHPDHPDWLVRALKADEKLGYLHLGLSDGSWLRCRARMGRA